MLTVAIHGILNKSEDIFTCLNEKDNDALPVLDTNFMLPSNSIFFIEATCTYLSWREACSVESAARVNPDTPINLFFTKSISQYRLRNSILSTLLSLPNVKVARIHLEEYAKTTPLHGSLKESLHNKELNMEISDILKYLTVFKYGGTYLALDVLVTNPFREYQANFVVKETNLKISTDVFSFSSNDNGRKLAMLAFGILRSHFLMPEKYFSDNAIMDKVLALWCGTTDPFNFVAANCNGLQIIGPNHLVPMSILKNLFSSEKEIKQWRSHKIYAYDAWSSYENDFSKSLSDKIAVDYCPLVNLYYGNKISS
ncbi:unnamed protein product [Arctia plantaginis]|uniref:Alpha-1,4-N-acetylglucosaminyltransferase n=1 Tax=Arctia plantaginis TaxID=874455 RepID=A0A8S1B3Y5_ARCPL|nr:unnamed protein product [Arctia plantaginis]